MEQKGKVIYVAVVDTGEERGHIVLGAYRTMDSARAAVEEWCDEEADDDAVWIETAVWVWAYWPRGLGGTTNTWGEVWITELQ